MCLIVADNTGRRPSFAQAFESRNGRGQREVRPARPAFLRQFASAVPGESVQAAWRQLLPALLPHLCKARHALLAALDACQRRNVARCSRWWVRSWQLQPTPRRFTAACSRRSPWHTACESAATFLQPTVQFLAVARGGFASAQRGGGGKTCPISPTTHLCHAALLTRPGSSWSSTAQSRSARQSRLAAAAFGSPTLAVSRLGAVQQLESHTSWLHCGAACRGPAAVNAPLP